MEFLRKVLGEKYEEFKGVLEKYNDENKDKVVKLADLSSGEYVSKAKYDTLSGEKENLKTQLKTANGTIKTLKENNSGNEALQVEIAGYKTTIANLETESSNIKKTYALKEQLSKAGVVDPKMVPIK